jgi:integrase
MPTTAKPLTKRGVDAMTPGARDQFHWEGGDGAVKGFGVKVTPAGRKSFVFQYDDANSVSRRVTIGTYGALTVDQAREAARQLAAQARAARQDPTRLDPATARVQAKRATAARHATPTVRELGARYVDRLQQRGKSLETIRQYRGILERHVGPAIGALKVSDVTRRDVAALHEAISAAAPTMANRAINMLSAMLTMAEREEWRPAGQNPCRAVEKNPERRRQRVLAEAEYRAIGAALARIEAKGFGRVKGLDERATRTAEAPRRQRGTPADTQALTPHQARALQLFRFLALSGWRESEGRTLRWSEITWERAIATLPETKTGRSVRPLGRAALAVLERVRAMPQDGGGASSEYVFPAAASRQPDIGEGRERRTPRTGHARRLWRAVWAVAQDELRRMAGEATDPGEAHALRALVAVEDTVEQHDLRHGFATTGRELGAGDHVIAQLIGHATPRGMTARYGGVPEAIVRRFADEISATIAARLDAKPTGAAVIPIERARRGL